MKLFETKPAPKVLGTISGEDLAAVEAWSANAVALVGPEAKKLSQWDGVLFQVIKAIAVLSREVGALTEDKGRYRNSDIGALRTKGGSDGLEER